MLSESTVRRELAKLRKMDAETGLTQRQCDDAFVVEMVMRWMLGQDVARPTTVVSLSW